MFRSNLNTKRKSYARRRPFHGVRGSGKYSFGKQARKFFTSDVGRAIRHKIVDKIKGSGLYTGANYRGRGLYTGQGEYVDNQLIAGSDQKPLHGSFSNNETGSVTYSARQFVRILNAPSTGAFTTETLAINPGIAATYPWLSGIAANFEEYRFKQLIFEVQSTLDNTTLQANGQAGTIIIAADYNVNDSTFLNAEDLMQYHGAVSGKITDNLRCGVEMHPGKGRSGSTRFIRQAPHRLGTDLDEYDLGQVVLAYNNIPSALYNQQVGYLWVYYTVELMKPKTQKSRGEDIRNFLAAASSNLSHNAPLGPSTMIDTRVGQQNSIPCALDLSTAREITIVFPTWFSGDVRIVFRSEGVGFGFSGTGQWSLSGQTSFLSDIYANGFGTGATPSHEVKYFNGTSGAATDYYAEVHVRVKSAVGGVNNAVKLLVGMTGSTSMSSSSLDVSEYNSSQATSLTNQATKWVHYNDHSVVGTI